MSGKVTKQSPNSLAPPSESGSFLTVPNLKQRRHSDNSLQIAKTLASAASSSSINRPTSSLGSSLSPSPTPICRARSSSCLPGPSSRRRHSSVSSHDIQRFATRWMDKAGESVVESVEKASKVRVFLCAHTPASKETCFRFLPSLHCCHFVVSVLQRGTRV